MEKTIYFEEDAVVILDQTKLPGQVVFEKIETIDQAAEAIKTKSPGSTADWSSSCLCPGHGRKNTQDRNRYWKPIFGIGKHTGFHQANGCQPLLGPGKNGKSLQGKP